MKGNGKSRGVFAEGALCLTRFMSYFVK